MADVARAERLRELRAGTHLSREKVAQEVGVTTKSLYEWENGGAIRWSNAEKLAAYYGVETESLVEREEKEYTVVEIRHLDRIESKLDDLSRQLTETQIDLATALATNHKILKSLAAATQSAPKRGASKGTGSRAA